MKQLKFFATLVDPILSKEKTVTFRFFDEKNLSAGDQLELLNASTGESFGTASIVSVVEKPVHELSTDELSSNSYASIDEVIATNRQYYGDGINADTLVKIVRFALRS